jgi:acyl-CoA synthetase (NDP forming)
LLMDATGILRAPEIIESSREKLLSKMKQIRFPVAMKVQGPLHKSDEKGVILNVSSIEEVNKNIDTLIKIDKAVGIMVQPMFSGLELFIGVKKEKGFNHTILCGLGGIYIEILNDVSAGLSPISKEEARRMITSLRGYKLMEGARGEDGIDESQFAEIIQRVSALVEVAPEIIEMDINPLIGTKEKITVVDVRIKIEKEYK